MKYNGKNLLITGLNGFIGSAAAKYFLKQGYHVIGLVKDFNMKTRPEIHKKCSIVHGNILDFELVKWTLSKYEVDYVIHLAANPIVRICNNDPYSTYSVNVMGTLNLLEACRTLKRTPQKILVKTCYDDKTRVLTTNGFKTYDKITTEDKVFSINPETKEIQYAEIEEIVIQDYEGPMVSFQGKSCDLMVTPNHKMLINDNTQLNYIRADQSIDSYGWNYPYGNWHGDTNAKFPELPSFSNHIKRINLNPNIEDLLYLLGIYIGDGCIEQQYKTRENKSGYSKKDYLQKCVDPSTHRFIKNKERGPVETHTTHSNVVYLYIPYKDSCRPRLESCLDRLGIKFSNWNHEGEGAITFSSAELCYWFQDCGNNALNKTIPRWALDFPKEQLQHLLDGIIDSDGNSNTRKQIVTSSKFLVETVSELAIKCNYDISVYQRKEPLNKPKINGREIISQPSFTLTLSSQNKKLTNKNKKTCNYKGKIWCLRLKQNKNFIVERNGKLIFCGNSDKAYGPHASLPYKETSELVVADSYCTSKACQDMVARSYAMTYGLPIIVVRAGNIYGPGDLNLSRLVPNTIRLLLNNQSPVLYSGVAQYIREFIYVDNVVNAYDVLLNKGVNGEAYNIGGTEPQKIQFVIEKIRDLINSDIAIEIIEKDFYEIPAQYLDSTKLEQLGWSPKISLEEGLRHTIKWFRKFKI